MTEVEVFLTHGVELVNDLISDDAAQNVKYQPNK